MRKKELVKYQKSVLEALNLYEGDRNKPYIISNSKVYSVNDIIREVESLSDFGLKQLRSWAKTKRI